MNPALAIDLGFTSTEVAFFDEQGPVAIPLRGSPILLALNAEGMGLPSVVTVTTGGEVVAGQEAEAQFVNAPARTLTGVTRAIALEFDALSSARPAAWAGIEFAMSSDGGVALQVDGNVYPPERLCAVLIEAARLGSARYLRVVPEAGFIALPGAMSKRGRAVVAAAASAAGLDLRGIIPSVAAIGLALAATPATGPYRAAICRMGGGSFDVALAEVEHSRVRLLSHRFGARGGVDLDTAIADWVVSKVMAAHNVDLRGDRAAHRRLVKVAEEVKRELSRAEQTSINLPFVSFGPRGPVNVDENFTRADLDALARPICDGMVAEAREALRESGAGSVDHVVLVGGMCQVRALRAGLKEVFGGAPLADFQPVGAIARGLALHAAGADRSLSIPRLAT